MIRLELVPQAGTTVLSNLFIDRYMPAANGEFVKVYIYLLRNLSADTASFSLEAMADCLQNTEKDILRALTYWENLQLLTLSYNEKKELSTIRLQNIPQAESPAPQSAELLASSADSGAALLADPKDGEKTALRTDTLTPERIRALRENEEVLQLLYITEQYLGKTLTPSEMRKLLYLYDELHLSADLLEYLVEYCVTNNHKSVRYMESVGLAWAQSGIRTVSQAKQTAGSYKKEYFRILKALGITGRVPVPSEIERMDSWLKEYGFSMEIILEACSRTILKTGQPSFPYTDSILKDWNRRNVHSLKDIELLDSEHQKHHSAKEASRQARPVQNRFNNFQQRTYDFQEYEKRLLNQS